MNGGDGGLKIGCPVCGYGVDWTWFAFDWWATKSGCPLSYFPLGWMIWEYLCQRCHEWATANGARWDETKLRFGFEGFKAAAS